MKLYLTPLLFLFCSVIAIAQVTTHGGQSPVIKGAKAKVSYVNEQRTKLNIPDSLATYLAGLLMTNRVSSKSSIDNALLVWMRKYNELKAAIARADVNKRAQAFMELDKGNFSGVESLLGLHTNYTAIIRQFPNTYQTNGDQSPIIIGDYANVTYAVTQVIEYKLPDGLTTNLLTELKAKENFLEKQGARIKGLEQNVQSKAELVQKWVAQYKVIEQQLKNSPDAVSRKAYAFFADGKLKEALAALNSASGSEVVMARNRILKARILLLQLNYDSLDVQLKTIRTYFATSVPFLSDYGNLMDYSRFLIDYLQDGATAVPVLLQLLEIANGLNEQIEVRNYLSLAYGATNKVKAIEYLEEALHLLDKAELLKDDTLLEKKALLQYNLAMATTSGISDTLQLRKAIGLINGAILTNKKVTINQKVIQYRNAVFEWSMGRHYFLLGDSTTARLKYMSSLRYLESAFAKEPQPYAGPLSTAYMSMGELYSRTNDNMMALAYFRKAQDVIEPRLSTNSTAYFQGMTQIYTAIVRTFEVLKQQDSIFTYLRRLEKLIEPFATINNPLFNFFQAELFTDIGRSCLSVNNLPSARSYLTKAFNYFSLNVSQIQMDPDKFRTCIAALNQVYLISKQVDTAIAFNVRIEEKLKWLAATNPYGRYEDFLPWVYMQLAETYAILPDGTDRAIAYADQANRLSAVTASQYPLLYKSYYFDVIIRECALALSKDRLNKADTIVRQYCNTWEDIYRVNESARNFCRAEVSSGIGRLAFLFQQGANNQQLSIASRKHAAALAGYCFDKGNTHFSWMNNKMPFQQLQFSEFLVARAGYEYNMAELGFDGEQSGHMARKCSYAREARELIRDIPGSSPYAVQLMQQAERLCVGCN